MIIKEESPEAAPRLAVKVDADGAIVLDDSGDDEEIILIDMDDDIEMVQEAPPAAAAEW